MKAHLKAIFQSYSEIFFLEGMGIGILLMGATLVNWNAAVGGMIAAVAAYLFANFIRMDKSFLKSGFYTYNPLLVGLSIGYLFRITPLTVFLIVVASILTFVVTHLSANIFSYYLRLPILSLPFVLVSSIAYLASSRYTNLFVNNLYPQFFSPLEWYLPFWLSGLLKNLGAILFIPDVLVGILVLILIGSASRILGFLILLGYYTGTLIVAAMEGNIQQAFSNVNHFNFIWIAMAIGGIFLIPSIKSYVLAMIAVATSTILLKAVEVFWASYGIPAFALPFNLISWSFIYVLGSINYQLLTRYVKSTPEESLDYYLSTLNRFRGNERTLALPFAGKWTVWQGFNGQWTHQGSWRYAYDFIVTDEQGKSYQNEGLALSDYYTFRKPVLSPVRGRVVKVVQSLPDNPIKQVDRTNNWGNLVVIYDLRGFYVEISHFLQESIRVKEGQWVERGALLGLCGNSGYSPQPHIHIQVQLTEEIGGYTLPFSFTGYVCGDTYHANDLPAEASVVEPLHQNKQLDIKMSFVLDQQYHYEIIKSGKKIEQISLTVRMAPDGTFYFDSGKGKLYFGKHEGTFYFYHIEGRDEYLQLLFIALPRMPLSARKQLRWDDYVPAGAVIRGFKKAALLFLCSFYHDLNKIKGQFVYLDDHLIKGTLTSNFLKFSGETRVEMDEYSGWKTIQVNDLILRRIENEMDNGNAAAAMSAGSTAKYQT